MEYWYVNTKLDGKAARQNLILGNPKKKFKKLICCKVWRINMELAACFGTAKPRAGGGASAQPAIVPSSNEPRRSARLKTTASQDTSYTN